MKTVENKTGSSRDVFIRGFCRCVCLMVLMGVGSSLQGCTGSETCYELQSESSSQAEIGGTSGAEENASEVGTSGAEEKAGETPSEAGASGSAENTEKAGGTKAVDPEEPENVVAYICGAVRNPGVYELPGGSRICDLIAAAGGMLAEAETRIVNQAAPVSEGMQVIIYTQEECQCVGQENPAAVISADGQNLDGDVQQSAESYAAADATSAVGTAGTHQAGSKININTADKTALMTLNGIGEARAEAIIQYRTAHGGFDRIEAIMQVSGIKEKLFEKFKDQIEV